MQLTQIRNHFYSGININSNITKGLNSSTTTTNTSPKLKFTYGRNQTSSKPTKYTQKSKENKIIYTSSIDSNIKDKEKNNSSNNISQSNVSKNKNNTTLEMKCGDFKINKINNFYKKWYKNGVKILADLYNFAQN